MKKLIRGIQQFRKQSLAEYRDKYANLVHGQNPDTLFIACCDSRVVPNVFASTDPGDLFVLRNVGNLVPPHQERLNSNEIEDASVAATIEFALLCLNVSHIVICGHSECGAMRYFTDNNSASPKFSFLNTWLEHAIPSYKRFQNIPTNQLKLAAHNVLSQINVLQQLDHLKTYPWVNERLKSQHLKIHGWWFDIATADVHYHDSNKRDFTIIDNDEAEKLLSTF